MGEWVGAWGSDYKEHVGYALPGLIALMSFIAWVGVLTNFSAGSSTILVPP